MRLRLLALILFGAIVITGCSRPYQQPFVYAAANPSDPSSKEFDGIASLLSEGETAQLFWTHGICPHQPDWANERMHQLADRLAPDGTADVSELMVRPIKEDGAKIATGTITVPQKGKLAVTFLLWSDIVDKYRGYIVTHGNADLTRASFNKQLQDVLMNKCLVDAVVYSGRNGDAIRLAAWIAICEFMGGQVTEQNCRFGTKEMPKAAFVSESIGSKIMVDALSYLWDQPAADAERNLVRSMLTERMDSVSAVYLMANQVPILDTASMRPDALKETGFGSLSIFYDMLAPRAAAGLPKLTIVAFTDPNDLLSYPLPRVGPAGTRVVNIIVSNDWTYLGRLERPDTAHCGYEVNPAVLELSTQGYRADQPQTFERASASAAACLSE